MVQPWTLTLTGLNKFLVFQMLVRVLFWLPAWVFSMLMEEFFIFFSPTTPGKIRHSFLHLEIMTHSCDSLKSQSHRNGFVTLSTLTCFNNFLISFGISRDRGPVCCLLRSFSVLHVAGKVLFKMVRFNMAGSDQVCVCLVYLMAIVSEIYFFM